MESLKRSNLVGREFILTYGTLVKVVGRMGNNWRVKNLAANHVTNYEVGDFYKSIKSETKRSLIGRYCEFIKG